MFLSLLVKAMASLSSPSISGCRCKIGSRLGHGKGSGVSQGL